MRRPWVVGFALLALAGGCGDSSTDETVSDTSVASSATTDIGPTSSGEAPVSTIAGDPVDLSDVQAPSSLPDGPLSVVALGDSLTEGMGDDDGTGYPGRLIDLIDGLDGRSGSTMTNLGRSGWDSAMLLSGGDGVDPPVDAAVDELSVAVSDGRGALALVLIGSNDLWYLYEYGPEEGTPADQEDAALATYRQNLETTVSRLAESGSAVAVGLVDDQTLRPVIADEDIRSATFPAITEAEVGQMSAMAGRFNEVVEEVAGAHGAIVVDMRADLFVQDETLIDDGAHPNAAGYEEMATIWFEGLAPLLGS